MRAAISSWGASVSPVGSAVLAAEPFPLPRGASMVPPMARANGFAKAWVVALALLAGCSNELETENARLKGQLGDLRRQYQGLQGRLNSLESENQSLLRQMRDLGQNVSNLSEARAALERELQAARLREQQAQERLASFRHMIEQFRDMIASGQLRVRIVRGKMVVELPE